MKPPLAERLLMYVLTTATIAIFVGGMFQSGTLVPQEPTTPPTFEEVLAAWHAQNTPYRGPGSIDDGGEPFDVEAVYSVDDLDAVFLMFFEAGARWEFPRAFKAGVVSPAAQTYWIPEPIRKVDVNVAVFASEEERVAHLKELRRLVNIGVTLSERILESRIVDGPFPTLDHLSRVRGIGGITVQEIKDQGIAVAE